MRQSLVSDWSNTVCAIVWGISLVGLPIVVPITYATLPAAKTRIFAISLMCVEVGYLYWQTTGVVLSLGVIVVSVVLALLLFPLISFAPRVPTMRQRSAKAHPVKHALSAHYARNSRDKAARNVLIRRLYARANAAQQQNDAEAGN